MTTTHVVLGSEDCPISKVAMLLKSSPSFSQFHDNWPFIATDLETRRDLVKTLRRNYIDNKITLIDIVHELLEEWLARESGNATLHKLAQALEENGLKDCAQMIVKGITEDQKRKTSENAKRKRTIKYRRLPPDLQDFLTSGSKLCILHTLDIDITREKILENMENPRFHDYIQFAEICSSPEERVGLIDVVKDCTVDILKKLYKLCDKAENKVVLITSEKVAFINGVLAQLTFSKNQPQIIPDNMDWDDLAPSYQLKIIENLEKKYKVGFVNEQFHGQLLVDLIHGMDVKLFKETFPKGLSYYVERTVSTRKYISLKIFEQNSPDIFLFTGMDRYELSKLAMSKLTGNSSNQLQQSEVSVKFMIIDQPNHFAKIAEKSPHPVHLIVYESGKLLWIKSKGNLKTLQNYVDPSQAELQEEEFIQNLSSDTNQAVIISDSPGMGKSVLLAKIGRRLEIKHPRRNVFFLVLSEFIKQVRGKEPDELITNIKQVLTNMLCENVVGKAVFTQKLESEEISVELLFDGLDEVDSDHINLAYVILHSISTFKSTRFWVTSRPHLLEELEIKLNVFGHNINPFDESNQVNFLTSYWSRDELLNHTKLENFARECLKNLKLKMDSKDHDIAGIPLQCYLLGYIFEEEAIANENSEGTSPQPILITNIADLYKLLINKKFAKYFSFYEVQNTSLMETRKKSLMEMHVKFSLQLVFSHSSGMLDELWQSSVDLEELLKVGIVESSSTQGSPRFLHRTFAEYILAWFVVDKLGSEKDWQDTMTVFIFKKMLRREIDSEKYNSVGSSESEKYIFRFAYPVIAYFMNALVINIKSISSHFSSLLVKISAKSPLALMRIAHACVKDNFSNLIKLLYSTNAFQKESEIIFSKKCLLLSIDYAELGLVTFVLQQFEQHHNWELDEQIQAEVLLRAIKRGKFCMVEFLIKEKGLHQLVKDFKKCKHFKSSLLICVKDTTNSSAPEIEERVQILRLLVGIKQQLLEEKGEITNYEWLVETPICKNHVHVELRIELVRLGANVFAQSKKYENTVLHQATDLSTTAYHTFLGSLSEESLRKLAHIKNTYGYTPLMSVIEKFDPLRETLTLFRNAGANFNLADKRGNTILKIAMDCNRNVDVLKTLVKYGANLNDTINNTQTENQADQLLNFQPDLQWTQNSSQVWTTVICQHKIETFENELTLFKRECVEDGVELNLQYQDAEGNSWLHIAALYQNVRVVKYLVDKEGLDVKTKNKKQQTALHSSADAQNSLKDGKIDKLEITFLVEHGADVYARDEANHTFVHYYISRLNKSHYVDNYYNIFVQKLVEYLVMKGHSSLFKTMAGVDRVTPFHLLFTSRREYNIPNKETLTLFHSSGINFNVVDNNGDSVLYYAIRNNCINKDTDYISVLIDHGTDWKLLNNHHESVLHTAAQHGSVELLKFLQGLEGLDVNQMNKDNNTPLHYVLIHEKDRIEISIKCKLLIEKGADIKIKNKDGDTPLEIALKRKLTNVKLLRALGSSLYVGCSCH